MAHLSELVGKVITSCNGKAYTVVSVCDKRAVLARENGKTVNVSRKLMDACRADLVSGKRLAKQANRPAGGISYTIAIEAGVVACLRAEGTAVEYDSAAREFYLAK